MMLSDQQFVELERMFFKNSYLPLIVKKFHEEGFSTNEFTTEGISIVDTHVALASIKIYSPRNTFRFIRIGHMLEHSSTSDADRNYFYCIILLISIPEDKRLTIIEKNIFHENNEERWLDLL